MAPATCLPPWASGSPASPHFHPPCPGSGLRTWNLAWLARQGYAPGGLGLAEPAASSSTVRLPGSVSLSVGLPPGLALDRTGLWAGLAAVPAPGHRGDLLNASGTDSFAQRQHPTRHRPPGRRWDEPPSLRG